MRYQFVSLLSLTGLILSSNSYGGVFNLTNYLEETNWSLGLEPEIQLSTTAGAGGMAKFTYGLNEMSNVQAGVGTGTGSRRFRAGGAITMDFVPDLENQPGIGIAAQSYFVRNKAPQSPINNALELTLVPYIHKSFESGAATLDPFVALPFGLSLEEGRYKTISSLSLGSNFKASSNLTYTAEINIGMKSSETAISGGFTYIH